MISVIVCSKNKLLYDKFARNVSATIGMQYEIIRIDNSTNEFGICHAYNMGAAASQYDLICFVHEDVLFKTKNWGICVYEHLQKEGIGAIGIAGAAYKAVVPSSWSVAKGYRAMHLVQYYKDKRRCKLIYELPANTANYPVNVLDGVFIGTKREVWQAYHFDEMHFTGFHGYDIDFSFGISLFTSLEVVFDIAIEHYSEGKPNKSWLEAVMYFSDKWRSYLPASTPKINIPAKAEWQLHIAALKLFYKRLNAFGYSRFQVVRKLKKYGVLKSEPEKSRRLILKILKGSRYFL